MATVAMSKGNMDLFDEELFLALLRNANTSRVRVNQLTQVALQHVHHAFDICHALRRALYEPYTFNNEYHQAIWYVLDSLLKHAPMMFLPLIMPELYEWVVHRMPWNVLRLHITRHNTVKVEESNEGQSLEEHKELESSSSSSSPRNTLIKGEEEEHKDSNLYINSIPDRQTEVSNTSPERTAQRKAEADKLWFESLIESWVYLLPRDVYEPIYEYAVRVRSEATISKNLIQAQNKSSGSSYVNNSKSIPELQEQHRQESNVLSAIAENQEGKIMNRNTLDANQESRENVRVASVMQIHELQDEWDRLRYLCRTKIQPQYDRVTEMFDSFTQFITDKEHGKSGNAEAQVNNLQKAQSSTSNINTLNNTLNSNNTNKSIKNKSKEKGNGEWENKKEGEGEEEDEEEYNPKFVAGAVARELPKVELPAALQRKRRRDARQRRRREEDDL